MIIIHAKNYVNASKEEEFVNEIQQLISASKAESGNISYDLFKDTAEEHAYMMVEVWQDLEAVDAHNKSEHFTSFVAKAPEYLSRPIELKVFNGKQIK
ncbi:putative quinol monooxygenase [Fictibacillus sp. FJAT-27399]|uniref:putative quinol monooxygenase n=1 Tax=Fictibacillus sp. FJAT-27399 TaxID=1729689 RepID=UPI00078315EA|nr:putative quinol monooxygenase [Fictibacillus sp. FJAT-27399]